MKSGAAVSVLATAQVLTLGSDFRDAWWKRRVVGSALSGREGIVGSGQAGQGRRGLRLGKARRRCCCRISRA